MSEISGAGRAASHPGMAYFAMTGPAGKSCFQCAHAVSNGYKATTKAKPGELKDIGCGKYGDLMNGAKGKAFPARTPSCKYFDLAEKALPLWAPKT